MRDLRHGTWRAASISAFCLHLHLATFNYPVLTSTPYILLHGAPSSSFSSKSSCRSLEDDQSVHATLNSGKLTASCTRHEHRTRIQIKHQPYSTEKDERTERIWRTRADGHDRTTAFEQDGNPPSHLGQLYLQEELFFHNETQMSHHPTSREISGRPKKGGNTRQLNHA